MTRVLVVEDEPGIAFALEADLTQEGYSVSVATRGDEALRLAADGSFDLMLLDVMLPGKDGFDVCRDLRRARIKALLRRSATETTDVFRFGDAQVDFARCEVRRGGQVVDLSALEFKLLTAFVKARGRVLTREQLLDAAWGHDVTLNDRVVDNHIVALRRKLEPDPARSRFLLNLRGLGYRFDA